jgi:hypothetical protein
MGGKKKAAKAKAPSAAEAAPAPEPVSEEVAVAAPAQEEPVEMPVETAPAPAEPASAPVEPASAPVVAATVRPRKARPALRPRIRAAQPPAGALGKRSWVLDQPRLWYPVAGKQPVCACLVRG